MVTVEKLPPEFLPFFWLLSQAFPVSLIPQLGRLEKAVTADYPITAGTPDGKQRVTQELVNAMRLYLQFTARARGSE